MLNQTVKMMLNRVGTYWHMLPTHRQGRKVVWQAMDKQGRKVIDQVFPSPLRRKEPNNTEMTIELKNGSIFQVVGSDNFDSLVGTNPVHVTFSEWAISKPSAWSYIRPILAENEGSAAFIYTPRRTLHSKEMAAIARTNPDWFFAKQTIEDTQAYPLSVIQEERDSGMPEELVRQEYYCDEDAANAGSYYGDLIDKLRIEGLIDNFSYLHSDVYTTWDIGFTDSTAIWFWRFRSDQSVDVIDCYEAHGLPVNHYIELLNSKPYTYVKHLLPHDAGDGRFKFATGLSIREQIMGALPNVEVLPKLSIESGIQAARVLLSPSAKTRIHSRNCKPGIAALEFYQREYDEDTRTFAQKPNHDWSSHYADAFRYLAISVERLRQQYFTPIYTPPPVKTIHDATLDELWKDQVRRGRL
jgi:phage terminase large subunit